MSARMPINAFPLAALVLLHPMIGFAKTSRPVLDLESPAQSEALAKPTPASPTIGDTAWIADWSFDLPAGACTDAGWSRYDNRILNDGSNYWSIRNSYGGTGGIVDNAAVLAKHDLAWARDGYGNGWDYSIILKYAGAGASLGFAYLSDSEPGFDFVTVEADSAGASETRVDYTVNPAATASQYRSQLLSLEGVQNATVSSLSLPDFGVPLTTHEVYLRFVSDIAYSDEDGLYSTVWNAGLVVDNIVVTGSLAYSENFEAALDPNVAFANTAPSTPFGEWARLYPSVTDNDACNVDNTTCSWLWSDPSLPALSPDMAFGPGGTVVRNWLDDLIVSPWVPLPASTIGSTTVLSYRRFPGNDFSKGRIVQSWSVRALRRIDNTDTSIPGDSINAVGAWMHAVNWNSLTTFRWITSTADMTPYIDAGATAIQVRFRVSDWQYISGATPPSTLDPGPGPYLDRVRIGRVVASGPFFPDPAPSTATAADGCASVRTVIGPGEDFTPSFDRFGTVDFTCPMISLGQGGSYGDSATYNTRDSLVISVRDVRETGAIWVNLFASIVSGPHAGKAPPPLTVGANGFFVANADSAQRYGGGWQTDSWFVDLDDEYFRAGDKVVYFWGASDAAGGFTSWPPGLAAVPGSVAEAQQATGGLCEFAALPAIDWDPSYLARIAADPSGKIDPTPAEIANSVQRTNILYVWMRPSRRSGAAHRTAFMRTLDQLGYQDLYDRFFIPTYWLTYLGHVAARISVEQASHYALIIQDAHVANWNVIPPPDFRERPVPQMQWYRDWLAQAPMSAAGRATFWLLGDVFMTSDEGQTPLVQQDMGVVMVHQPQTLLPYPEIRGQGTFTWADGDSTNFAGDRLVLDSSSPCNPRSNTGLGATGTAVVTHRYTLGGATGDGAMVMNANPATKWNTILGSFSWEDLLDPADSSPGNRRADLLDEILTGVLTDSVRALANPTDVPDRTSAVPGATVLHQNAPNPFNPVTTIRFDLARAGRVRLQIYDVAGRRVRTLVDEWRDTGWNQRVTWNGLDDGGHRVASGIYLYRLTAGEVSSTRKMIVVR